VADRPKPFRPNYDDAIYASVCDRCNRSFLHVWGSLKWCRPCLLAVTLDSSQGPN